MSYLLVVVLHNFCFKLKENEDKGDDLPYFLFFLKSIQRLYASVRTEQNSKSIQILTKMKAANPYRFEKQKQQAGT